MTDRQAYSLDVLTREVNAHAPKRSRASDGGRASPDHTAANPGSDHEPNALHVWTAHDYTDDPAGGLDGSDLFHRLLERMREGHPALRSGAYLIHNRFIVSYDRLSEGLRPYGGYNAHLTHVHVSVSDRPAGYDSLTPFNLWSGTVPTPKPPSATALKVQRIRNLWVSERIADRGLMSEVQRTGSPTWAGPMDKAGDAIDAAMRELFGKD